MSLAKPCGRYFEPCHSLDRSTPRLVLFAGVAMSKPTRSWILFEVVIKVIKVRPLVIHGLGRGVMLPSGAFEVGAYLV